MRLVVARRPLLTETESGKRSDRPELRKALDYCKRNKGTKLVVATLSRLTRDTKFLLTLIDGSVDVVFTDEPIFDRDVLAFDIASFCKSQTKCGQESIIGRYRAKKSDCRLLRPCRQRPCRRAAEKADELPSSQTIEQQVPTTGSRTAPHPTQLGVSRSGVCDLLRGAPGDPRNVGLCVGTLRRIEPVLSGSAY
jgi:Resolvase, N terminal domain